MQEQKSSIAVSDENSARTAGRRFLSTHVVDVIFVLFLFVLAEQYYSYVSTYQVPMWDAAAYLTNAGDWLRGTPLFAIYRPPLISWIIAGVWAFRGENWQSVEYLSAVFGIGSAVVLYLTLRHGKGALFGLGVVALTMLNPQVLFYSTQVYTETLSLFFLVGTLYLVKSERTTNWYLAGICVALTFASRYPILVQAALIVGVESYSRREWQIIRNAVLGAIPVFLVTVVSMFLKTGTFQLASAPNTNFAALSPYYLLNSISVWGWVFLLVPLALMLRKTYSDRYNRVFVAWLVVSLIFWSLNATRDLRFTIQLTPAVNFLAMLAIETFVKSSEPLRQFLSRQLIFIPKVRATPAT